MTYWSTRPSPLWTHLLVGCDVLVHEHVLVLVHMLVLVDALVGGLRCPCAYACLVHVLVLVRCKCTRPGPSIREVVVQDFRPLQGGQ